MPTAVREIGTHIDEAVKAAVLFKSRDSFQLRELRVKRRSGWRSRNVVPTTFWERRPRARSRSQARAS